MRVKNKDKKEVGLAKFMLSGDARRHVSSGLLVRMRGIYFMRTGRAHLFSRTHTEDMASTESEDWTVEEDGEPTGEPVASTTSARATSSDREEEEEDDEEMADEGYGVEEEEQQQQEEEALGSPEEVRVAVASEEDSDLVQTETIRREKTVTKRLKKTSKTRSTSTKKEKEREREAVRLTRRSRRLARESGITEMANETKRLRSQRLPLRRPPRERGEGGGEALVTQRDEAIENYQSTVKELTAAVIEREQKIGAHQLESTVSFFLHTVVYVLCITLSFSLLSNICRYS